MPAATYIPFEEVYARLAVDASDPVAKTVGLDDMFVVLFEFVLFILVLLLVLLLVSLVLLVRVLLVLFVDFNSLLSRKYL